MSCVPADPNALLLELTQAVSEVLTTTGKSPLSAWSDEHSILRGEAPFDFDSFDLAQLSTVLEERFGTDPYSAGEMPRTLGELRRFFEARAGRKGA